jgi:hypothetical protein
MLLPARKLLPTLAAFMALASPAAAASFDEADYWNYADDMQSRLDETWDEKAGRYRPGGGGADSMINADLLLTHSLAALHGHEGSARDDHRARLVLEALMERAYVKKKPTNVAKATHAHAPGWTSSMNPRGGDQHMVYDAQVIEALTAAWRARKELDLRESTVEMIVDRVRSVANGSYWRYPALKLNQVNWYISVYAAKATVTGDGRAFARDTRRQLHRFLGDARNFGPGLRFHYLPTQALNHPMNVDSAEYANVVMTAVRYYESARRAGMAPLPAADLRLLKQWVTRVIAGYWTHAGYMNWDSGLGFDRWHQSKKLGLTQQALIGIAATEAVQPTSAWGGYAKSMLDASLETFERWSERSADGLAPAVLFGVSKVPQGRASARLGASRVLANAARAADSGLGAKKTRTVPALYAFDPDIGRLAITTPHYNTAIVAVNQGAFPYGGVELARLFDAEQDPAGGIGGRAPAAFGVMVRDLRGRRVMASQVGRASVSRATTPLRLVHAPRGVWARASSGTRSAYAGAFTSLRAVGSSRAGGFSVVTHHTFTPRSITTKWAIRGAGRRASVDVLFPSWGRGARIVAVLRDGTRVRVGGKRISLSRIASFEVASKDATYTVTPLSRPRGATAHLIATRKQSSAPDPGPSLGVQLARGTAVRVKSFGARVGVQ